MRSPRAALLAAGAALLAACGSAPRAPESFRTTSVSRAPGEFGAMRSVLVQVAFAREAKDSATLRTLFPDALAAGRRLLAMPPPHDLDREDIPRFLEARASFTDELNAYGRAQAAPDDAALLRTAKALEDAYWAWYDVYRGRAPEGAV